MRADLALRPTQQIDRAVFQRAPKQQYLYKTLDDVLKEQSTRFQNKKPGEQTREKIIDMTGREQRVLHNYDSISSKQQEREQVFSLEELTHNLDLVIESCEEAMIRSHRRYVTRRIALCRQLSRLPCYSGRRKFDEDTTVALKYDLAHVQKMMQEEQTKMNRLHVLVNMIDQYVIDISRTALRILVVF